MGDISMKSLESEDQIDGQMTNAGIDATTLAVASSTLARWRQVVRNVLLTAGTEDDWTALRRLASWYERMTLDPGYANPPPDDGLTALIALAGKSQTWEVRLAVTYHAVQVAQALRACRWFSSPDVDTAEQRQVLLSRLEVALRSLAEVTDRLL
jgi:hypothetical protein